MDEPPTEDPLEHVAWAQSLPLPEHDTPTPLSPKQVSLLQELVNNPGAVRDRAMGKLRSWVERKTTVGTCEYCI